MKKPGFIICAPLQVANMSNGVRALIQMAKTLEKFGRTVHMAQILGKDDELVVGESLYTCQPKTELERDFVAKLLQSADNFGIRYLTDFTRENLDASYVVYPECVLYNPLNARHVIRYFLNRDGILKQGRTVAAGPNDFILAHSKVMNPQAHQVCHFYQADPLFNREDTVPVKERTMDLSYVGKGSLYGITGIAPQTLGITRNWPETKEQLAILLRNCRFFYTADACSNINNEVLSCGAIPVFADNGPWTDAEIDSFDAGPMPRIRPGMSLDAHFFDAFELARDRYLEGLRQCEQRWEPSVQQLIEKVDRHFALTPAALAPPVE